MTLLTVYGDLLESDCTVIAHQANCISTMGSGIAKQIKEKYPEAYEADCKSPLIPTQKLGNFTCAPIGDIRVVNLYGQYDYGTDKVYTNYEALYLSIDKMFSFLDRTQDDFKLGMPHKIGCGRAGGDWNIVQQILITQSMKWNKDIYLYKFN